MGVELSAKFEFVASEPRIPNGMNREHHFAHAGCRLAPGHAEALGDVGLNLAA